ncbi:MAG: hypothetical protein J7L96_03520 [Bacteroidales bacterium]|nr:hypothetical protein [Bacteroidales bacterium]
MMNRIFPTKEAKVSKLVKKFMGLGLDEAIARSSRLKKVQLHEFSGYDDYIQILDDYVEKIKKRKAAIRLDIATDEEIQISKWLDHEAWFILNYIKPLISSFVEGLEKKLNKIKREESNVERK